MKTFHHGGACLGSAGQIGVQKGFPQSSLEQLEGLGATSEYHSKIMTSSRDQQKFTFCSSFLASHCRNLDENIVNQENGRLVL